MGRFVFWMLALIANITAFVLAVRAADTTFGAVFAVASIASASNALLAFKSAVRSAR